MSREHWFANESFQFLYSIQEFYCLLDSGSFMLNRIEKIVIWPIM